MHRDHEARLDAILPVNPATHPDVVAGAAPVVPVIQLVVVRGDDDAARVARNPSEGGKVYDLADIHHIPAVGGEELVIILPALDLQEGGDFTLPDDSPINRPQLGQLLKFHTP